MTTFNRSRARTSLPDSTRATPHSRAVRHDPKIAGGTAVKCMVSGYHMKWKPALPGILHLVWGNVMSKTLCHIPWQVETPGCILPSVKVFLHPFALPPSLFLAELETCLPYPGCYPHLVADAVFKPAFHSRSLPTDTRSPPLC